MIQTEKKPKNHSFKITSDDKIFIIDFSIVSDNLEISIKNE